SDYFWESEKLPSKRSIIKNFRKSNKTAGEALAAWQEGQSSELDEKATELLAKLLTKYDGTIRMDITYSDLDLDWRFTVAISEAFNASVTPAIEGLSTG